MLNAESINRIIDELRKKLFELSEKAPCKDSFEEYEILLRSVQDAYGDASLETLKEGMTRFDYDKPSYEYKGETYRFKYRAPHQVLTSFGKLSIERNVYQDAKDQHTAAPLDIALGFHGENMALDVRRLMAMSVSYMPAEDVSKVVIESGYRGCPHPTQIKKNGINVGEALRKNEPAIQAAASKTEGVPEGAKAVVISMDGTCVRLNKKGDSKQGRPQERPGLHDSEEAKSSYKNVMTGVISWYGAVPEGEKSPKRLAGTYLAQMPELNATTFKKRLLEEVSLSFAKAPEGVQKVFLCDGARSIWTFFEETPELRNCIPIVDYYHASEHLSLAAETLFPQDAEAAKKWFDKYTGVLLEDENGVDSILRSAKYYASKSRLPAANRRQLDAQRTYFLNNKHRMNYALYRKMGLPIGSGPVEAACKVLVKQRMCNSGMRWGHRGGQSILDIRAYVKSNRWDAAWDVYKDSLRAA